jgi:hypothetical protein
MKNIHIVEDNPAYRKAAALYFATRSEFKTHFSWDYADAKQNISNASVDGTLIDVFFPFHTDSGIITPGQQVVEKLIAADPREQHVRAGFKVLEQYIDLTDPEVQMYARDVLSNMRSGEDFARSPIALAIKQVSMLGKEVATHIFKNTLQGSYHKDRAAKDYYGAIAKAMVAHESNQPLGILVAEQAEEARIPFVLVTSTFHHDLLTQPIVDYAGRRGWPLIDCAQGNENEKATPQFWERAFSVLERKLQ